MVTILKFIFGVLKIPIAYRVKADKQGHYTVDRRKFFKWKKLGVGYTWKDVHDLVVNDK